MNALSVYLSKLQGNADYLLVLVFIFLASAALFGGGLYFLMRQNFITSRLNRFSSTGNKNRSVNRSLLLNEEEKGWSAKLIKTLAGIHNPKEEKAVHNIKLKLVRAGLRTRKAYRYYLASKAASACIPPLIYLLTTSFYKFSPQAITISALLFVAGFFFPELVIQHITQKRQEGMSKALPDALDLMVVCVESGLGLDMTFKRVGDELREINTDLSDEFYLTNMEIRAGRPRNDSLRNMAWRTGISEISNLMTILIQTNRFGTSVADALRTHADAMRIKRRQIAEERAAKAGVKIIIPLILFILPALLIVLVGPAGIQIFKTFVPAMSGG
ncbi:MAG: type II secretion system F family protein [Desulfurivibrionaceae bacterium]